MEQYEKLWELIANHLGLSLGERFIVKDKKTGHKAYCSPLKFTTKGIYSASHRPYDQSRRIASPQAMRILLGNYIIEPYKEE